jgi:radical SAM protein with 4Fe4S-binding SPASM domain
MPPKPAAQPHTGDVARSAQSSRLDLSGPVVKLVPQDPGLPPRASVVEPDTQCDCACLAVEGQAIPPLQAPVSFFLELTPSCNNRCPGCGNVFSERGPGGPVLSAKQWGQILDRIQASAFRLKLTGGEPTCHPEFETIVEQIAGRDIPFTLFTNGRWGSPKRLITLLGSIPGIKGLLVSLHGPTAFSHEAFTSVAGSFVETVLNTQRAIEAGLQVSLSCIITQHNWDLTDDVVDLAHKIGASSVVFNRYLGREILGLTASTSQLQSALQQIQALRAAGEPVRLGNCVPQCFASTGQSGCLSGIALLTVDPWGRARPCNHSPLLCGNLLEQTVEEVWRDPVMDRWRQYIPAPCKTCALLPTCRGGCRAQAMISGKSDPLIRSPFHPAAGQPTQELLLFEHARPVGRFACQPEGFGTLLIAGNRLFPLAHDMHLLLEMLDGQNTLSQIQARCGQPGLATVASLYQQGMIELL